MLCCFLLYKKLDQLHAYTHPCPRRAPSPLPGPSLRDGCLLPEEGATAIGSGHPRSPGTVQAEAEARQDPSQNPGQDTRPGNLRLPRERLEMHRQPEAAYLFLFLSQTFFSVPPFLFISSFFRPLRSCDHRVISHASNLCPFLVLSSPFPFNFQASQKKYEMETCLIFETDLILFLQIFALGL